MSASKHLGKCSCTTRTSYRNSSVEWPAHIASVLNMANTQQSLEFGCFCRELIILNATKHVNSNVNLVLLYKTQFRFEIHCFAGSQQSPSFWNRVDTYKTFTDAAWSDSEMGFTS